MLGKRAIIDIPTVLLFAMTLVALVKLKKTPEPLVIAVAGLAGFAIKTFAP